MTPIRGLICIDIWEHRLNSNDVSRVEDSCNQWLVQLISKLKEFEFDSIINATYDKKIDFTDKSIYNTFLAYNWTQFDEKVMLELVKNSSNRLEMNKRFNDELFGENTFALYSVDSFVKHANHLVPHVKDWLVVGQAWGHCVHFRNLGLIELAKVPEHNFYGTTWGFFQSDRFDQVLSDNDFELDNQIDWTKVGVDMYKVVGKKHQK